MIEKGFTKQGLVLVQKISRVGSNSVTGCLNKEGRLDQG